MVDDPFACSEGEEAFEQETHTVGKGGQTSNLEDTTEFGKIFGPLDNPYGWRAKHNGYIKIIERYYDHMQPVVSRINKWLRESTKLVHDSLSLHLEDNDALHCRINIRISLRGAHIEPAAVCHDMRYSYSQQVRKLITSWDFITVMDEMAVGYVEEPEQPSKKQVDA